MGDKVIWSEGMVLSPQHLQQADLLADTQLRVHSRILSPFHYGLSALDIDNQALEGGFFSLRSCAGVFPDGTHFETPGPDAGVQQRPYEELFPPDRERLGVYLGVPALSEGDPNLAKGGGRGRPARFQPQARPEVDIYHDNQRREILFGRLDLRLLFEGESLEGFQSLKLAELKRDASGKAVLDGDFIPACLRISAAASLLDRLKRLLDICAQKWTYLMGQRAQKPGGAALFQAESLTQYLMLSAISRHMPVLSHLHRQPQFHPERLFSQLLGLAGDLLGFAPEARPGDLPSYAHGDLRQSFWPLFQAIEAMLGLAVPTGYRIFPFLRTSPIQHVANLKDADLEALSDFYLAVTAQASEVDIITTVQRKAKVGPVARLESIVNAAMPGIPLIPEAQPPRAMPAKAGFKYFRLQQSGDLWDMVKQGRALAVHMPSDLPGLKLELVGV